MNLFYFFVFLFFLSCDNKEPEPGEFVVARVENNILTKKSLFSLVGGKTSNKELLSRAIKSWVEEKLLYKAAISVGLDRDLTLREQRDGFYQNLIISTYIGLLSKEKNKITKKEVSDYYLKNKQSFKRKEEEITVKHFVFEKKEQAQKIKKEIKRKKTKKGLEKLLENLRVETKTIKEGDAGSNLVGFVFSGKVGDVLGPKENGGKFHLFQILQKYETGSFLGLELVYDEVYQRIAKQKEILFLDAIIDSLYLSSDVFISNSAFK